MSIILLYAVDFGFGGDVSTVGGKSDCDTPLAPQGVGCFGDLQQCIVEVRLQDGCLVVNAPTISYCNGSFGKVEIMGYAVLKNKMYNFVVGGCGCLVRLVRAGGP